MINRYPLIEKTQWGRLLELSENLHVHVIESEGFTFSENQQLHSFFTNYRKSNSCHLIQIWEPEFLFNEELVVAMLEAKIGKFTQIHGRKCELVTLEADELREFIDTNHLQGLVKAKYGLGLKAEGILVAAASFSEPRKMTIEHEEPYLSGELIRFCNARGYRVYGGLDKLLKHYVRLFKVNDIMTYSDIDWSDGAVYEKLGFKKKETLEPMAFELIGRKRKRIHEPEPDGKYIWNSGSDKFILVL